MPVAFSAKVADEDEVTVGAVFKRAIVTVKVLEALSNVPSFAMTLKTRVLPFVNEDPSFVNAKASINASYDVLLATKSAEFVLF